MKGPDGAKQNSPGGANARSAASVERLEAARRRLEAEISDLEGELAEIAATTKESPDDEHDAEGPTVGFERARVGSLLARARQAATELERALSRVGAGSYGLCLRCGRPIAPERLEALPATRWCVSCAELGEATTRP